MKALRWYMLFALLPLFAGYGYAQLHPVLAPAARRGAPAEPKYARLVRGELCVWESGTTISRHKIVAGPDRTDGRGLTIAGADPAKPLTGVTVQDCMVQSNGDDGLSVSGNTRRIKILRTRVMGLYQWPDPLDFSRTNKCLLLEGTRYYPDWLTIEDSSFAGGFRCPLIVGGVFRFRNCTFGPSRRNVWTQPKGDVIDCVFMVQVGMKVGTENPWSDSQAVFVRPICISDPKPDSLYFSGCSLTVIDSTGAVIRSGPATGHDLCRLLPADGRSPVGLDLDVPASTFRVKPNPTR